MTTPFSAPKNQQLTFSAVLLRILVLTDWTIYFLCLKHYDTVQCHFGRVEKGTKWLQQLCHTHLLLTMAFINCSSLLRRIFHFNIHLHGNRVYCFHIVIVVYVFFGLLIMYCMLYLCAFNIFIFQYLHLNQDQTYLKLLLYSLCRKWTLGLYIFPLVII